MKRISFVPTWLFFMFWLIGSFLLYSQSIRLDESQSIWVSTKSLPFLLRTTAQDVHVPLYGTLLHFWLQIFGPSINAARTLSLLFFAGTLITLYHLAKEVSSRKVALLTVSLYSLSPFILWYSSEARMYTLLTLATTLSHIAFLRFNRSDGREGKFGYVLSTIVGLYSHYFFLLLISAQVFYIWGRYVFGKKYNGASPYKRLVILHTVVVLISLAALIPWVAYVMKLGGASNTKPLIPPPSSFNLLQTFFVFLFGFQPTNTQSILISLWPLSVVFLFLIFTRKSRQIPSYGMGYFFLATFLPVFTAFFLSYIHPLFLSRYLIFVTPTLFLLLAWAIMNSASRASTYVVTSLFILLFGLMWYHNLSNATPVKEDYRAVSEYLEKKARPQDVIAVSAPFTVYPIEYSYKGSSRIETIPSWNRYEEGGIPPFSEEDLKKQIEQYRISYSHIILILSYDQGYENSIKNYFDKNYQLRTVKKFPPGIEVREYKLRYDIKAWLN